jgi:adenosylcobinamide-phosphate synthase
MRYILSAVILGFLLDLLLGDPRWLYHPVRIIRNEISILEKCIRKIFPKTPKGERAGGVLLVVLIVLTWTIIPGGLLYIAYRIWFGLGFLLQTFWCYQLLATRSLRDESTRVYTQLEKGDLPQARYAVSMIVGRDTESLSEEGVTKATVETIAENASDGVLAPLFYMMIGGALFGFIYKSINTMDSMVGYKNDKYLYFGTAAAKLDDVVNYIPARLSAWFMILGARISQMDYKNAIKIFKRDRYNHASPNSAQTEAVMAGALQVQLAGNAYYFGKLYEKKTIGDAIRPIRIDDIEKANHLLYSSAYLAVGLMGVIRFLVELALDLSRFAAL